MVIKKCRKCGVILTKENWYPSCKKNYDYICKKCLYEKIKKYNYEWRKKNPERWKEIKRRSNLKHRQTKRNWARKHSLYLRGKIIYGLNKRDFPKNSCCELCGLKVKRLNYHHWDDNNPNIGIWLCIKCHKLAEWIDKNNFKKILKKYIKIKKQLSKGEL